MKIDLKNKYQIAIILTVSVLSFMSAMVVLSPYTQGPLVQDSDKDGVADLDDNCPAASNPDQSDVDDDSNGDVCDSCTDTDGDGYGNSGFEANTCPDDNCPDTPNANQTDADHDFIGDVCDTCPNDPQNDADNDDVCGGVDNCPSVYNPAQSDSDADGIGNACELPPTADFTYIPSDPILGEIVQFSDITTLGGGVLQKWRWTFGDNTSSMEQHPQHLYMTTGLYPVQFNVTDINGKTSRITKNVNVIVNYPPEKPTITGPSIGKAGIEYSYKFKAIDSDANQIFYFINWGDNTSEENLGPYNSGYEANGNHSYGTPGRYIIKVKSRDAHNAESDYTSMTIHVTNIYILNPFFIQFFEQHHQILFFRILYI